MDQEKRTRYNSKIADLSRAGHKRNFKSLDETTKDNTKTFTKGISKDSTAPNLGEYARSKRFEEEPRRPTGSLGPKYYHEMTSGGLEVSEPEGLEEASSAPNVSSVEEIPPDAASDIIIYYNSSRYSPPKHKY